MFATGLSAPLKDQRELIEQIAGILLSLMGLFFLLTPFVTFLNREYRPEALIRRAGTGGPVIAGAAFAVGWTPCTGPILGAILTAASQRDGVGGGAFLLFAYSPAWPSRSSPARSPSSASPAASAGCATTTPSSP